MVRVAQFGIALGALGTILTLMGLFPGVTGISPTPTIGILQITAILTGFALLIFGALIYVKFAFYTGIPSTLTQQVAIRLAFTGLLLAALTGVADVLGFGSHTHALAVDTFIGPLQALGMIGNFLLAAFGVLIYALAGKPDA